MKHKFHVHGMNCSACVILIEEKLSEADGVHEVKVNLSEKIVEITGDLKGEIADIAEHLNFYILSHGYKLSLEKEVRPKNGGDFLYAIPLAVLLISVFFLFQKIDFVNLVDSNEVGYLTAFLIGAVASISTCLAVVGGFVLSLSVNYAKMGAKWKPQAMFHVGRLAGFFVLGGLIGLLGSAFQLSANSALAVNILVGGVMIILGVNLLDVFHFTKRLQPTAPKFLSRYAVQASSGATHMFAPLLLGIVTFFLPCGFTQSMQIYALSTGSFITGALTMFIFALGTLPVLALLSFGAFNIGNKPYAGVFFKTAGLIVIALAVFNLINSLAGAGIISPIFNF